MKTILKNAKNYSETKQFNYQPITRRRNRVAGSRAMWLSGFESQSQILFFSLLYNFKTFSLFITLLNWNSNLIIYIYILVRDLRI